MLLTIIICFLQLVSVADRDSIPNGNSFYNHSKSQAKYYISQVKADTNIEENLWALTLLGSENREIKSFIEEKAQETEELNIFANFENTFQSQLKKVVFQTGSPNLLIALLLNTDNTADRKKISREYITKYDLPANSEINFSKLTEAIINKDKISTEILPSHKFLLPHFFLLWDSNYSTLFTNTYYNNIKKSWTKNYSSPQNIHNTLAEVSYFRILYLTNNYSESASLYNSLSNNKLLPNSTLKLKTYQFLDYTMYRLGYYDRSLKIVRQQTLPLATYLGEEKERISIKQLQGVYLYSIGKIKAAEQIYSEILHEIDETNLNISRSSLYNNIALAYHKLGKYNDYLKFQFKALSIAEDKENYDHQLNILKNLFVYYRESNNPEEAINYLNKAERLAVKKNKSNDLGTIYTLYGSFYRKFKTNFQKAHSFYSKAASVLNSENNTRQYIKLLNEIALTFEEQKKYDQSIEKHNEIISLSGEERGISYIDALVNKAQIYLKRENIDQAKTLIEKFKSFDLNQLDFNQIVKAKKVEAEYLSKTENKDEALDILEPTLKQIVVRAQSSTDLKSGFWHVEDEYLDAFELAASIYMDTGQPGKAVEKLDQLKTINDASLYQNPLVKSSLLNESELTEYKKITNQLDVVRKKLLTAPEDEQFKIRQQINQLNTKKRKYDRRLSKNIDQNPTSIRQIQNKLSARELLLHITELKDQYYIAKISRTDIDLKTIDLDDKRRQLFSNTAQQIATHETNLDSLYKISQLLELKEIPDYVDKITLIPDSYFYQLPLDILPLEKPSKSYSYGEATYAIEKFKTQYLTTLEDFKTPNRSSSASKTQMNYVGYGVSNFDNYTNQSLVPLPYAQSEVIQIAESLTNLSQVETYINEQSTKSTFKQTAPHSQVLHLATHSEVSERDPMFSTVYFNKSTAGTDSTFDDRFFAYELFELDLSNEMVMLNSCESGSGSYIQGTGVMGISRALRYAGAESLILNLWSVNDMLASEFAVQFYSNLNEGQSKAEALRAAKQYFLNSKNADPHFWGPYMLIGNTDPIVEPQQDKNMAMAGAFIFYFLLMAGLSYLAQQGIIFSKQ
ncbi:CHAT domain-containing protein [Fodinibius sp. AD559]|uniref:CHAT domain-containing protein n=1 Tax=Fodinibius sp. AD559 TaxID=3424179 RepID=UPI004046FF62